MAIVRDGSPANGRRRPMEDRIGWPTLYYNQFVVLLWKQFLVRVRSPRLVILQALNVRSCIYIYF